MMGPASKRHQHIVDFLTKILRIYVEQNDLEVVLSAPFQMKRENGREPDVLFVRTDHQDRLQDTYLDGSADLVVETVSPQSVRRDRGGTFGALLTAQRRREYEAGGVRVCTRMTISFRTCDVYLISAVPALSCNSARARAVADTSTS